MKPLPAYATTPAPTAEVVRLLLLGPGGWGKSTAAATFPNPVFIDFDNNLPAEFAGKYPTIPMWNREWLLTQKLSMNPSILGSAIANRPLMFLPQIFKDISTLDSDQTVVFDHLSAISDLLAICIKEDNSAEIKKNPYAFWAMWAEFLSALFDGIRKTRCNVVMICHEDELREPETNRLLGRRWLLPGQKFSPKVPTYFNNVFRQCRTYDVNRGGTLAVPGALTAQTAKLDYLWQIRPDAEFQYARTTIPGDKLYVKATYQSFLSRA